MANITIDDFLLKSYEHGWMIQQVKQRTRTSDHPEGEWKAGDSYEDAETLCHASSLTKAFQMLVERKMRLSDAETLAEVRETARELQKVFEVAVL